MRRPNSESERWTCTNERRPAHGPPKCRGGNEAVNVRVMMVMLLVVIDSCGIRLKKGKRREKGEGRGLYSRRQKERVEVMRVRELTRCSESH